MLGNRGAWGFSHLPASDAQQEANHIGLLLLLDFFHVLEGTHLDGSMLDECTGGMNWMLQKVNVPCRLTRGRRLSLSRKVRGRKRLKAEGCVWDASD